MASDEGIVTWAGLEVRHLQALLEVADRGSFSRAAERLGYTQSAVSQQISTLERMVGTDLFDRPGGPQRVTLTPEGEAFAVHARAVVSRLVDAAAEIRALTDGEQGTLRVGTIQSVGRRVLPELLRRFRQSHPGVNVQLEESQDPQTFLPRMVAGHLDVVFAPVPVPASASDVPLTTRFVVEDPFVLVAPADAPEAARPAVSLDDVVRLPLIGYRSDWCRAIAAERLAAAGHVPSYVFESDDNPTMQGLVGAGQGYSFNTLLSIDPDDPATAVVRLDPPVEPRHVAMVWPRQRRPPAVLEAFVETAEKVCADLGLGA